MGTKNFDIEYSSYDSENESDSNETLVGNDGDKQRPKFKYLKFTPDALKYITAGHKFAAKNPKKYAEKGLDHNMCFKMIKSDSRLVKSVLYSYGFTHCSRKNVNINFIWANTHLNAQMLRTLLPWQRMNHFPRSVSITKKDLLHQNLSMMKKAFGNCYDFYPESFVLPDDKELLDAYYAEKETCPPLISKPATSSRGRGICIVTSPVQIEALEAHEKSKVVLSEYISNPYLVNGRKFDLRLYVTVISFQPLIAYMFDDGLTRFAVDEYTGDDTTYTETFKHLTNYSLNKFSENFVKNNDPTQEDVGHKWTLSALLRHLSKEGIDTKLLMVRMEDIVIKTLLSIQSQVSAAIRSTGLGPNVCFELFGFDVLIDSDLKPWLLEVNLSPSLACDAPLDAILKTRVLCDTLNLAMIPLILDKNGENVAVGDEENAMETNDNDAVSTASASSMPASRSSSPSIPSSTTKKGRAPFRKANSLERRKPYNPAGRVKIYANRLKLNEKGRKGDFIRIFPRKENFYLYKNMIEEIDYRHEKQDMLLYQAMFDEDPDKYEADIEECHKELMDAKNFKSTSDLSPETVGFLQQALDEAAQYEAEKHENGYRLYPKALPRIHPYARRRTASQVLADEIRRQTRLESLIKPLEQELLKVANASTANILLDIK